jgi:hypothetical protein
MRWPGSPEEKPPSLPCERHVKEPGGFDSMRSGDGDSEPDRRQRARPAPASPTGQGPGRPGPEGSGRMGAALDAIAGVALLYDIVCGYNRFP